MFFLKEAYNKPAYGKGKFALKPLIKKVIGSIKTTALIY